MHDIRFIRENPAAFDAGLKKRNLAPLSAEILEIDKRRRAAISESEAIQAKRKSLSQQVGMAKRKGENADALMAEVAGLEESLKKGEADAAELDAELTRRLEVLPNLPFADVPDGTDETASAASATSASRPRTTWRWARPPARWISPPPAGCPAPASSS